jgi:hypothetical protein
MPSSRYTPSSYGDIDSGGWDNPLPRSHKCEIHSASDIHYPNRDPRPRPDDPGPWAHDKCQFCGYVGDTRSNSVSTPIPHNDQPRGRGQLRAPSIENDTWAPAPARTQPVQIEPPKSKNGDDWGPTPTSHGQAPPSDNNDDGGDWGVPAPPAPTRSINNYNGNGNGNHNTSLPTSRSQYRSTSRYDDEEDIEDDGDIPPPTSDPVHGAYVPWTGVT